MRYYWVLALVAGALAIDSLYDDYDVDSYAADAPSMRGLVYCVLQEGPCDPFAQHMRDNFREALRTACAVCNPKQAQLYRKVTVAVAQHFPVEHKRIEVKYDPENKYVPAYLNFIQGTA